MSDRMTEPIEPYEPEPSYDWDYGGEAPQPARILWGRIIVFGAVILFFFMLGRVTKSGGDASAEALREARASNQELRDEVEALNAQLSAQPPADETPAPDSTEGTDGGETTGETYVVKANDTLNRIAEKQYGDPSLADCIAAANGIADPTNISVGQELTIPPEAACG